MAQAVKGYVSKAPKQPKMPAAMISPEYEEKDPYRLQHGLRAWSTDGHGTSSSAAVPAPARTFEAARLPASITAAFKDAGFKAPTPIQAQVWTIAATGRDVIGIAKTGSGKTLAFLVPAYKWMAAQWRTGFRVLVCAPTRELATQIHEEASKFAEASGFTSACVYGGQPKRDQLPALRSGAQILVATPGRLLDFLESKDLSLASVGYVVFDEADRMLDMGFEPQIRDVMKKVPRQRQTLMFSATWPEDVQNLAHDFLNQPMHIQAGDPSSLSANEDIKQQVVMLNSSEEKDSALVRVLKECKNLVSERVLVFVAMKRQCDFVERMLKKKGIAADTMHSDKDQQQREEALQRFRSGETSVLVATDVAARGLDIKGISLVVNYDSANSTEDHVHRIGRTGRAGEKGRSVTFLTRSGEDVWKAVGIAEVMEKAGCPVPAEMKQLVDRMLQKRQQAKINDHKWDDLPKVLMVAEKPSVCKLIAEYLSGGRMRFRKGQSRAVQTYEFVQWFQPAHQKCRICVTSTIGHVFGLDFGNNRVPDVADMYWDQCKKTIEENTSKNRIVEHLQELAAESEYLALWLDCDKEGENICFEVSSLCASIAPDNVYRAHFSALTQPEIKYAFNNLGRPDKHLAQAVDARQELDLKIGCTFTRMMTRTFLHSAIEKFRLREQKCLSYGPCQTPTLWFCVERHKEIEKFQRQAFYKPKATVKFGEWPLELSWGEDQTFDASRMQTLERKAGSAKQATFKEWRATPKSARRPEGLNTVQLLKAASTGLGMAPAQCMKVAEHLYSSGYISYPRTETTRYSETFDLEAALREQAGHPTWGKTVGFLLREGNIRRPAPGKDAGDHPPITPMKAAPRDEFSKGNEWRLYDYITRHFIASLSGDVKYTEHRIVFDVGGEEFVFLYHTVEDRGFLFATPWRAKDLRLEELDWEMPDLAPGTKLPVEEVWVDSDMTSPPDYLTEAELVARMDAQGIGTDASIPTHIQNICDRHYVMVCGPGEDGKRGDVIYKGGKKGRKGKGKGKSKDGKGKGKEERPASRHMVPSPLGLSFCAAFEELDSELCRPPIRAFMEQQVQQIADGILDKDDVVNQNLELFHSKFVAFRDKLWKLEKFFVPKDQQGNFSYDSWGSGGGKGGKGSKGGSSSWGSGGEKANNSTWSNGFGKKGSGEKASKSSGKAGSGKGKGGKDVGAKGGKGNKKW
eukprot:TRINITY_DN7354_c0_g2_i1.p1 TRINITY_DN7354_c0_g2~~TRINITY_DN7354_c0_g2_i1.p1  ORF type:complete len:1373 (+),score=227.90 TRINITY_DN7354_c0_g2_i1:530-4120(+)